MNQFPPALLKVFGNEWFETGHVALHFKNATVDRELVQVFVTEPDSGSEQSRIWMERDDGLLVCEGTAGLGPNKASALRSIDFRACDPEELRILRRLHPGMSLGEYEVLTTTDKQYDHYDKDLINDPLEWYRHDSPWGDPIAAPRTVLEFVWGSAMVVLASIVEKSAFLGRWKSRFPRGRCSWTRVIRLKPLRSG